MRILERRQLDTKEGGKQTQKRASKQKKIGEHTKQGRRHEKAGEMLNKYKGGLEGTNLPPEFVYPCH